MTPDGARASHRRFLTDRVSVVRYQKGSTVEANRVDDVHARLLEYVKPRSETDNHQGWQKAIILVEDLTKGAFPLPMKVGDVIEITAQNRKVKVEGVDQNTRKVDTEIIAYECIVQGS